jgi:type IV pilus assembly protein PilV
MLKGRKIMHPSAAPKSTQRGVLLIEALVAILIFSVGVLAIVGLQANMLKNTADSKYRSEASYIAQARIGQMWADPANLASYIEANTDISALLPGGKRTVTQPTPGQFTVTVGWTGPNDTPAASATTAPCFMTVAHCFTATTLITGG